MVVVSLTDHALTAAAQHLEKMNARAALAELGPVLATQPDHAQALTLSGFAILQLGDPVAARSVLSRAVALAPGNPDTLRAFSIASLGAGALDAAEEAARQVLAMRPGDAAAFIGLANVLVQLGRLEEADTLYREAKRADPESALAAYNHAFLLLLQGQLREGWPGFERRTEANPRLHGQLAGHHVRWRGEDAPGKTLLITSEQGLGDNIQFIRFAAQVRSRVGRVLVGAPPVLERLFAAVDGVDEVCRDDTIAEGVDLRCSVMSLPAVLEVEETTIPSCPYLKVADEAVARWRGELASLPGCLRIGLNWSGNPANPLNRDRSTSLARFAPLWDAADACFVPLQIGEAARDMTDPPGPLHPVFNDPLPLEELAALMLALDLVITVDTAVAHLGGAVGAPVWTLLKHVPDWRWLLDRSDSPWYASMRLYRQPSLGGWDAVMAAVARDLAALSARAANA